VVVKRQRRCRRSGQQNHAQRGQNGAPGQAVILSLPDQAPRRAGRNAALPRQCQGQQQRTPPPQHQPVEYTLGNGNGNIAHAFIRAFQVRAAVFQAGKRAHLPAIRQFRGFLGVKVQSERGGIGLFRLLAQGSRHQVKNTQHFRRILARSAVLGLRQGEPQVQRIQQADCGEGRQYHGGNHAHPAARHLAPGSDEVLMAPDAPAIESHSGHQQPDQGIGPQQDRLEQDHSRRIRGSTKV